MTNCEQTLNNINILVEAIANKQGDNTSDIVEIKTMVSDFATGVNDVLNKMIANQEMLAENQKAIFDQNVFLNKRLNGIGNDILENYKMLSAVHDFNQRASDMLGV